MSLPFSRPVLQIRWSLSDWLVEVASGIGVILATYLLMSYWSQLPDRVPIHFGISGRPDGWGAKRMLLALPIIVAASYIGLSLLSRYPHIYNYPFQLTSDNVERQYRIARTMIEWIKLDMVWSFTAVQWQAMRVALGQASGVGVWLLALVAVLPLVILAVGIQQAYRAR